MLFELPPKLPRPGGYAADAWGYSYGIASEWTQNWWTLGLASSTSRVFRTPTLETNFCQFELVAEAEWRHAWWGEQGKLKLLGFLDRGRMGSYNDALRLAQITGQTPDAALVRRYASRPGMSINLEQQSDDNLGAFVRASLNDGSKKGLRVHRNQPFCFSRRPGL